MQLHCMEKNGKQTTRMVSYCAYHRYRILNYNILLPSSLSTASFTGLAFTKRFPSLWELHIYGFIWNSFYSFLSSFNLNHVYISCRAPNPDTVLIMQTPLGVISTKSLLQTKRKAGSRLISSKRIKVEDTSPAENTRHEPFSAARCRIYRRTNHTKKVA